MRMGSVKRIEITSVMLSTMIPGCSVNNPVTTALKEQVYLAAREIVVAADEIYVDGVMLIPMTDTIKFIADWHAGRKLKPCILGFREW